MIESQVQAVGIVPGEQDPAAFKAWQDSKPRWTPIEEYRGGDVLLRLGDNRAAFAYGTRNPDGTWVQFWDGEELPLNAVATTETVRSGPEVDAETITVTRPARIPTDFCEIPFAAAVHFMIP